MGVTEQSINKLLLDSRGMQSILMEPNAMVSNQYLVNFIGGDIRAEAAAYIIANEHGAQHMELLQQLTDGDSIPNEELARQAKEVLSGGLGALQPFLAVVFKAMDGEEVALSFSEPRSMPPLLREFLSQEEPALPPGDAGSEPSAEPEKDLLDAVLPDMADGEVFGDTVIPDTDLHKDYPIFGLFQNTSAVQVLKDAFPLYAVTMYSIWDIVTVRMLSLVQVKTIMVAASGMREGGEVQVQERRWLYDMRYNVLQGDHLCIGLIGIAGLCIWSIGSLAVLLRTLRKNRYRLQEVLMMRNYGYFFNGLEPKAYWWELLVKRLDVLLLSVISSTELFHDPRAKLIMYLGLAGVFWAAHNLYHPYDSRQNSLANRIEQLGLGTRFASILTVQVLLMVNTDSRVNAFMAMAMVAINVYFLCTVAFVFGLEIPNVDEDRGDEFTEKAVDKLKFGGGSNHITAFLIRIVKIVASYIIKPIVRAVLKVLDVLASMKQTSMNKVPRLQWFGGCNVIVVFTHEKEKLTWLEWLLARVFRHVYQLADHHQKSFVAQSISKFWDYMLNNAGSQELPACIMDIFFVLPGALQAECALESPDLSVPFYLRVAKRIRISLLETDRPAGGEPDLHKLMVKSSTRPTGAVRSLGADGVEGMSTMTSILSQRTSFKHSVEIPECTYSGEDFNSALLFIQRLAKEEVQEFLAEAKVPTVISSPAHH